MRNCVQVERCCSSLFLGVLGNPLVDSGHPFGLELFFRYKGAEKSLENEPFVFFFWAL